MPTVDLVAAVLRGDPAAETALRGLDRDDVIAVARDHGMLPLLADRVLSTTHGPFGRGLRDAIAGDAFADMAREQDLRQLLAALHAAGVSVLLMKGAALAYSHYARPDLRPRIDTDLLVAMPHRGPAHDVLIREGYRTTAQVSGEFVSQQATYLRVADGTVLHTVDLHWQIANPQVFGRVLTFDELATASMPVVTLGTGARALGTVHALLLACVHRVAHHADSDRLIWLYDIHLIASRFGRDEWEAFGTLAHERGVALICRRGLEHTIARFGTAVPASVLDGADLDSTTHAHEVSARFLERANGQLDVFLSDVQSLGSWRARLRLVREHLLPSADYMKRVYAPSSRAPLPWLYARRAWRGARKWLARG